MLHLADVDITEHAMKGWLLKVQFEDLEIISFP